MKKYSFALIAVLFAVATAFAFKPTFATWKFVGSTTSPADRVDPTMYSTNSITCSGSETNLCTIVAATSGGQPVIGIAGDQLYDDLYNGGSTTGPNFSPTNITGKNP